MRARKNVEEGHEDSSSGPSVYRYLNVAGCTVEEVHAQAFTLLDRLSFDMGSRDAFSSKPDVASDLKPWLLAS